MAAWQLRQVLAHPKEVLILGRTFGEYAFMKKQRTRQANKRSHQLLALQSDTYENWAIAQRCQGGFTEGASKVSLSRPETQGKEMRVIIHSWASTVQRLLNQWYGVRRWCSVVKMFTICVTPSLLWTLTVFKHKSTRVGNKTTIKPKYFKIPFSCILHKEILTLN